MAITQKYDLNLIPKDVPVVVPCSQYDEMSRVIEFTMYNGLSLYTIPAGSTVTVRGTKEDKTGFMYECTYSGAIVSVYLQTQMTAFSGNVVCELRIEKEEEILGTANFILYVERTALADDILISESELGLIEGAKEYSELAQEAAATAQAAAENINVKQLYINNAVKNTLALECNTETINGVTFTVNANGSITVSGSATAAIRYDLIYPRDYTGLIDLFGGVLNESYILHQGFTATAAEYATQYMAIVDEDNKELFRTPMQGYMGFNQASLKSALGSKKGTVSIQIARGTTVDKTYYPQIYASGLSDDFYEGAYNNIELTRRLQQSSLTMTLSQEEYDDLSTAEKNNGTIYFITD